MGKSILISAVNLLLLVVIFIFSIPLMFAISIMSLIFNGLPIFYKQERTGKDGKVFIIYKFRTMVINAQNQKNKLMKLNEVDGPVFKINDDPRFTKFGKILSRTGLDELPQLINILRREMNLVGPRPFPIEEAVKVPKQYKIREQVLPGIISPWVVNGMHQLKFKKWMELDTYYVRNRNFYLDSLIIYKSILLVLKNVYLVLINR